MVLESSQFVAGLGHIPNDWRVKTADEISLKITKGTTPPKEDIVERREIPFLRVNNLGFHGALDQKSDFIFVSRNAHEGFLARSKAYPGDILMNIVGPPLGKVSLLGNDFAEYNMNQAIVIYRLQDDVICRNYFLAYLLSDIAQQWLQSRSKKTSGQQNLTIELCKGLPVPIPAFVEQKKIAQILSTWDQAIATTEGLLDLARQQKKGLMQQLLTGKKRFPGFEGAWVTHLLEDLEDSGMVELGRGNVISKTDIENYPGDFPIYSSSVKNNGLMGVYGNHMFDEELISWSVDGGGDFFHRKKHKFSVTNVSGYMRINTEKLNYKFIASQLQLQHSALSFDYQSKAHPSVIRKLYRLAIPAIEEQVKIAEVLTTADQEVETLQSQLDGLKQEKKALMQALLTGKRRVKVES